jgi:uncharacterized protein (UPF0147 family)
MAQMMTVKVVATQLEKVKKVFQVIKDIADDNRIPVGIREEYIDKMNTIMEAEDEC